MRDGRSYRRQNDFRGGSGTRRSSRRFTPLAVRRICSHLCVDLGRVELIVAALDLKLVRLLRDAIRSADAAGRKFGPSAAIEPRLRIHPEPRFEPRRVIHPTPRYEPRPVIHPRPRVEEQPPINPPCEPVRCLPKLPALFQPPWRIMPWENPIPPAPKVKLNICRVDVVSKGSLIDIFI
jgi:hypothetical protein